MNRKNRFEYEIATTTGPPSDRFRGARPRGVGSLWSILPAVSGASVSAVATWSRTTASDESKRRYERDSLEVLGLARSNREAHRNEAANRAAAAGLDLSGNRAARREVSSATPSAPADDGGSRGETTRGPVAFRVGRKTCFSFVVPACACRRRRRLPRWRSLARSRARLVADERI